MLMSSHSHSHWKCLLSSSQLLQPRYLLQQLEVLRDALSAAKQLIKELSAQVAAATAVACTGGGPAKTASTYGGSRGGSSSKDGCSGSRHGTHREEAGHGPCSREVPHLWQPTRRRHDGQGAVADRPPLRTQATAEAVWLQLLQVRSQIIAVFEDTGLYDGSSVHLQAVLQFFWTKICALAATQLAHKPLVDSIFADV